MTGFVRVGSCLIAFKIMVLCALIADNSYAVQKKCSSQQRMIWDPKTPFIVLCTCESIIGWDDYSRPPCGFGRTRSPSPGRTNFSNFSWVGGRNINPVGRSTELQSAIWKILHCRCPIGNDSWTSLISVKINDLPNCLLYSYADDSTITFAGRDVEEISRCLH